MWRYDGRVSALRRWMVVAALAGSGGCGGSIDNPAAQTSWTAGVFQPASTFAAQCATPRVGTDPTTGKAYPDKAGSVLTQNNWLRSWTHDLYLWYREVPDVNPASSATA